MVSVVIEIDGQHNESLYFRPIQRTVRGRFDYMRDTEPMAKVAGGSEPNPIVGQRLGYSDGNGYVVEMLRTPEHKAIRDALERKGFRIPPEREEFENVDEATWLYWIDTAVRAGLARVVAGKLPENSQAPHN